MKSIKIIGYHGNAPVHSQIYSVDKWNVKEVKTSHAEYFGKNDGITLKGLFLGPYAINQPGERTTVHSFHPYEDNTDHWVGFLSPVVVSATQALIQYDDLALIEPAPDGAVFGTPEFNDYVVLEASTNGLDWVPLEDGYNARRYPEWASAWAANTIGSRSLLQHHEINLLDKFAAGDTLLFRYRLYSNASIAGWGVALDYVAIQEEPTGLAKTAGKEFLFAYPNPTTADVTARYSNTGPSVVLLEVLDLSGKIIHSQSGSHLTRGTQETFIPLRSVPPGAYIVRLSTVDGVRTTKIMVRR
jgi:Secretion system C-terminal sorting domain